MLNDLLTWYKKHGRHDLPWRHTRDPYKVLVSELMLQQTQVPRVIPKYNAFTKKWPTIQKLAKAEKRDVLRMWQGLGYNSRAVRLHTLAKLVVTEYGGILPTTREELLELPGIGPYTAGAVIIFAHNKPSESLDVNVIRVVKRISWTKRAKPSERAVAKKALALLTKPHDVQSALMDFGSTYCTTNPSCDICPLQKLCKSKGARPDETKKTQPTFKNSTRWWRGKILKLVLEKPQTKTTLRKQLKPNERFEQALQGLLKEGIIKHKNGKLTV